MSLLRASLVVEAMLHHIMVKDSFLQMHDLVTTGYVQREAADFSSSAHNQGPYLDVMPCGDK